MPKAAPLPNVGEGPRSRYGRRDAVEERPFRAAFTR